MDLKTKMLPKAEGNFFVLGQTNHMLPLYLASYFVIRI